MGLPSPATISSLLAMWTLVQALSEDWDEPPCHAQITKSVSKKSLDILKKQGLNSTRWENDNVSLVQFTLYTMTCYMLSTFNGDKNMTFSWWSALAEACKGSSASRQRCTKFCNGTCSINETDENQSWGWVKIVGSTTGKQLQWWLKIFSLTKRTILELYKFVTFKLFDHELCVFWDLYWTSFSLLSTGMRDVAYNEDVWGWADTFNFEQTTLPEFETLTVACLSELQHLLYVLCIWLSTTKKKQEQQEQEQKEQEQEQEQADRKTGSPREKITHQERPTIPLPQRPEPLWPSSLSHLASAEQVVPLGLTSPFRPAATSADQKVFRLLLGWASCHRLPSQVSGWPPAANEITNMIVIMINFFNVD